VEACTDAGLAVVINDHITQAGWCDGKNLCDAAWSNSHLGPLCRVRQSEDQWLDNWETMMRRFVDNPRVEAAPSGGALVPIASPEEVGMAYIGRF